MMDLNWINLTIVHHIKNKSQYLPLIIALSCMLILNSFVIIKLGPEMFLDSFQNPSDYITIEKETDVGEILLIIQKPTHPNFSIISNDKIFISTENGIFEAINIKSADNKIQNNTSKQNQTNICYNQQYNNGILIGKIITEGNTSLEHYAMTFWMFCKDNLNPFKIINEKNMR